MPRKIQSSINVGSGGSGGNFMLYKFKQIPYLTLYCPLNDQHFHKFTRGLDNGEYLVFKRVTKELFDYYCNVSKLKNKKNRKI